MEKIKPQGMVVILSFIIGIILIVGVALTISDDLGSKQQVISENLEQDITFVSTPQTVSLDLRPVVSSITVVDFNDSTAQNFSVNEFGLELTSLNATRDFNITYNGKPEVYADSALARLVLSFVGVLVAVAGLIFAAAFISQQRQ